MPMLFAPFAARVLIAALSAVPGLPILSTATSTAHVAPTTSTAVERCAEDDDCWNCQTMGDRRCGPVSAPSSTAGTPTAVLIAPASMVAHNGRTWNCDDALADGSGTPTAVLLLCGAGTAVVAP